jgi:hypothetical protein
MLTFSPHPPFTLLPISCYALGHDTAVRISAFASGHDTPVHTSRPFPYQKEFLLENCIVLINYNIRLFPKMRLPHSRDISWCNVPGCFHYRLAERKGLVWKCGRNKLIYISNFVTDNYGCWTKIDFRCHYDMRTVGQYNNRIYYIYS